MGKYTAYRTQWQRDQRAREAQNSEGKIQCQICSLWYRKPGAHIWQVHNISAREYRKKFGFDVKRGQIPPEDKAILRKYVFETGTVNNLKKGRRFWFKKGDKRAGRYNRSQETLDRLRERLRKLHSNKLI